MKIKRIVLAGLFLVSGVSVLTAQVKLSFNPEKGTKYEYRQELIQNSLSNVMGQDFEMITEMKVVYLMEIKDKTPEETNVQFTYREAAYKGSGPMMNMGFDSNNPDDKMFGKIIGQSFIAVIAPDGSVKSLTGIDEIAENMNHTLLAGDPMGEQMKQMFSGASLKNTFEQSFRIYPDHAVKEGDNWNSEFALTMDPMNTNTKTKYTLKEFNEQTATVDIESDVEVEMAASSIMEGKIAGTQSGVMLVDIPTGMPVSSDLKQKMQGMIVAQGYEIQMDMENKVNTSIKKQ